MELEESVELEASIASGRGLFVNAARSGGTTAERIAAQSERGQVENASTSFGYLTRRAIDGVERLFGWLHRWQRVEPSGHPVRVNLGSGLHVAPGWINIDSSLKTLFARLPDFALRWVFPLSTVRGAHSREEFVTLLRDHRFVYHNLKYGIPLPDSSADFIFSSHVLHHLYREDALKLVREAIRVLKPGGTMRIAVPDLEHIVALYLQGRRERALEYLFYAKRPRSDLNTRRYQYDFMLLKDLMEEAGVRNVRRCKFGEGRLPDLEQLDRLLQETLFVEGER
jgi:predicted SAM-dependent methyltransferase